MSDRVTVHGLQVSPVLYDFINTEALPGTGVDQDAFWSGAAAVVGEYAPRNRELLAIRDDLQAKVDQWHRDNPATDGKVDFDAYKQFLTDIGYLVTPPEAFEIGTQGVDTEISQTAGPQLVVPILNARFALNAANARWGSLYDALYGTDVISEADGAEKGRSYNTVRGDKVIAYAKAFLDAAVPLEQGSHADATKYVVDGDKVNLKVQLMSPAYGPREPLREHIDAALKKAGAKSVSIEWGYRMTTRDIGPDDMCPGVAIASSVQSGPRNTSPSLTSTSGLNPDSPPSSSCTSSWATLGSGRP